MSAYVIADPEAHVLSVGSGRLRAEKIGSRLALAWRFIPRAAVEVAPVSLLEDAAPLLEEEGNAGGPALVA